MVLYNSRNNFNTFFRYWLNTIRKFLCIKIPRLNVIEVSLDRFSDNTSQLNFLMSLSVYTFIAKDSDFFLQKLHLGLRCSILGLNKDTPPIQHIYYDLISTFKNHQR